MTMLQEVLTF